MILEKLFSINALGVQIKLHVGEMLNDSPALHKHGVPLAPSYYAIGLSQKAENVKVCARLSL